MSEQKQCRSAILVGAPNSGKSTIFNLLTSANQRTGNWSGVTVSARTVELSCGIDITDLPGVNSLSLPQTASADERVTLDYVLQGDYDLIINIVDAENYQRSMFLTAQLAKLGKQMIVVVNKEDLAARRNYAVDLNKLAQALALPGDQVLQLNARKRSGPNKLRSLLQNNNGFCAPKNWEFSNPKLASLEQKLRSETKDSVLLQAGMLKLEAAYLPTNYAPELCAKVEEIGSEIELSDLDMVIAAERFQIAAELTQATYRKQMLLPKEYGSKLDKVVLNRYLALPIFLMVLYLMFTATVVVGGAFSEFAELITMAFFVELPLTIVSNPIFVGVIQGVGQGLATTMAFVPVIGFLYLILGFLEDSGYLSRAAYIMDGYLRWIGLPGKSFIPLIVGFGCNVPGILATRTIDNSADRITTIMMSPFMSCGARLSVYSIFAIAFFERNAANVVFSLYLLGIILAVVTGLIVRKIIGSTGRSYLLIEMPRYQLPHLGQLLINTWGKVADFVASVGKIIVIFFVALQLLSMLPMVKDNQDALTKLAQVSTSAFAPMGIEEDNWPAVASIITGALAKEVVVGTLSAFYQNDDAPISGFSETLNAAVRSLDFTQEEDTQLLLAKEIQEHFKTPHAAYAYLLFVLLYFPCISVFAVIVNEIGKSWAVASALWSTVIAYSVAVLFFQTCNLLLGQDVMVIPVVFSLLLPAMMVASSRWFKKCI